MTDTYDGFHVALDPERRLLTITLDVPEKMNRVSMLAREQLAAVFAQAGADDAVRVVVIEGAGDRAFTAGGDIAGFMQRHPEHVSRLAWNVAAPERCPKPVIALLHGYTMGVGLELALACDFRIAADDLQLALPEVTLGMIPGSGGTQRMVRLVGLARAKDIVLRGRRVGAEEALRLGLVTEVVPFGELHAARDRLVEELSRLSPLALAVAKRVLNLAEDAPLHAGLQIEGFAYGMLRSTEDFAEGVAAFGEKRRPEFKGR
jgi:2-oxoglutaroyl-CoA hydrolase